MANKRLLTLCDIATEAHTRIQEDFKDINPVVGVSQNMRSNGVPADVMTIDCLKSGKRIIIVLHDQQPETVNYQFSFKEQSSTDEFEQFQFNELNATQLYHWIKIYFSSDKK